MIKKSHLKISRVFKIFLLILPVLAVGFIGLIKLKETLADHSLAEVASTLPMYNDTQITLGKRGIQDCYDLEGSSRCESLYIPIKSAHDTATETAKFINATKEQGIQWYDASDKTVSIDSKVFERNGKKYQIYLLHGSEGTRVSLLLYD